MFGEPLTETTALARHDSNHLHKLSFFVLTFLFCIGLEPINNVVIVSGEQQRDSASHILVSILHELF